LLIAESTSTGTITAEYVYLNGQPLAKIENNNIYYYHNDHLGTPMLMTDENQSIVWQGEFLPFGETYSISGTITNNLRFPGQYYDVETGLHYNWFRNYKPEVGRYLEKDISGIKRGTNHLYIYAKNNSLIYKDVMGLLCQVVRIDPKSWFEDHEEIIYGDWIYDYYIQFNIKCWCIFHRDKRIDVTRTWYTQITKLLKCTEKDDCGREHTYYKTETELKKEVSKFSKYGGREYKKVAGTMYSTPGEGLESGGGCDCEPLTLPPGFYD
jgi:RHS repeat-associated protein